jgi:hypothetical protein
MIRRIAHQTEPIYGATNRGVVFGTFILGAVIGTLVLVILATLHLSEDSKQLRNLQTRQEATLAADSLARCKLKLLMIELSRQWIPLVRFEHRTGMEHALEEGLPLVLSIPSGAQCLPTHGPYREQFRRGRAATRTIFRSFPSRAFPTAREVIASAPVIHRVFITRTLTRAGSVRTRVETRVVPQVRTQFVATTKTQTVVTQRTIVAEHTQTRVVEGAGRTVRVVDTVTHTVPVAVNTTVTRTVTQTVPTTVTQTVHEEGQQGEGKGNSEGEGHGKGKGKGEGEGNGKTPGKGKGKGKGKG